MKRTNIPDRFPVLLLSLCLLAVGVVSCDRRGEEEGGEVMGIPVTFATSVNAIDTRAQNSEVATDNIRSMGIFAYYTGQGDFTIAGYLANFMNHEKITRTGNTDPWTYTPVKYWPNTAGDKISFFAYAPYQAEGVSSSGPYLEYNVPDSEISHCDWVAAEPLLNTTKTASLSFTMKHVLTKVEFRIKSTDAVTIKGFCLSDVYRRGLLNCLNVPFTWDIYKTEREMEDGQMVLTDVDTAINQYNPKEIPANTLTTLACFYLLPEMPAIPPVFRLYGDNLLPSTETALPASQWKMGGYIIYTIVLDKIELSVTVSEGGSSNSGKWEDGGKEVIVDNTGMN